jgi:hypothetical protein
MRMRQKHPTYTTFARIARKAGKEYSDLLCRLFRVQGYQLVGMALTEGTAGQTRGNMGIV